MNTDAWGHQCIRTDVNRIHTHYGWDETDVIILLRVLSFVPQSVGQGTSH